MDEQTSKRNPLEDKIPDAVRQHVRTARQELRASIISLLPPEFVEHRRKARKEMLLAWRSMIDSALERIEEKAKEA